MPPAAYQSSKKRAGDELVQQQLHWLFLLSAAETQIAGLSCFL